MSRAAHWSGEEHSDRRSVGELILMMVDVVHGGIGPLHLEQEQSACASSVHLVSGVCTWLKLKKRKYDPIQSTDKLFGTETNFDLPFLAFEQKNSSSATN